jgi:hypothetical protein
MTTETAIEKGKLESKLLEPYIEALTGASGITEDQARICLIYALCTYRDGLEKKPILAIRGMTGTGKSALLSQMELFVKNPVRARASTYATTREEMFGCHTYLVDEGDKISEHLLLCRTDETISEITIMAPARGQGWKPKTGDVFGYTVIARRSPFGDAAVRNRAIVINTKYVEKEYQETPFLELDKIYHKLNIERVLRERSQRLSRFMRRNRALAG